MPTVTTEHMFDLPVEELWALFGDTSMSNGKAVAFTKSIYATGIGLMQKTLAARS